MDGAGTGGVDPQTSLQYASATSITVNGRQITGPVPPGATVAVKFNWAVQQNGPGEQCTGFCGQVVKVGFAGAGASVCLHESFFASSGTVTANLTAPATTGPAVVAIVRFLAFTCAATGHISSNPGFGSYMAVVAVK